MKLVVILLILGTIQASAANGKRDARKVTGTEMQQKRVTGRIIDSDGNALPGVNIIEKGTTNGAITDANGGFQMNVASEKSVLVFSFIGFVTQEVEVGTLSNLEIVLRSQTTALDEVVVVGYSTLTRKSLTGAISTVNATSLAETSSANPIQRLQGRVAGVTVLNQHTPGEGSTIRVRGMTTINDANPLYVVDGVPGGSYAPNDIETITILKDAAAQAIYGARAANGVVLITTKSGSKNQKISMNINIRQGITRNTSFYDLLNTAEYGEMLWLEAKNFGIAPNHPQYGNGTTPKTPDYIFPTAAAEGSAGVDPALYDNQLSVVDGDDTYLITRANKEGTDWLREAQRDAAYKEYNIDIAGGTQNTAYAFLLGYTREEGTFNFTGFDRYSFRTNINSSPAKWVDVGTNLSANFTSDYGFQGDNSESSNVSWAYRVPPIVPVYDVMGNYAGTRASGCGNAQSIMFLIDKNQYDGTKQINFSGNAYMKLNLLKGLSIKSLVGVNNYYYASRNINYVEVAHAERGTYDYYGESSGNGLNWTWTNTIEYALITGQHNIKVIGGSEAYNTTSSSIGAERSEYPFLDPDYMNLNTGLRSINNSGGGESGYSLFSLFARANYTYADKYLVEAVVRRDGSSRFGNQKYGIFPAFSLGWRISEESFMASTSSWLNELKLRVGYGVVGNDRMGNYNSFTQYAYSPNDACYPITGGQQVIGATGFRQTTLGNTEVKWESTATSNIGIDATLFKGLTVNFDLYSRITNDMLYPKQIPLVVANVSAPSINIGEMKNTGFDLTIGYANSALNGDFTYSADFVLGHYKNEIVKLSDNEGELYLGGTYREKRYTQTQTGYAFPEFFGYIVEGLFMDQAEADGWPKAFGATGTYNKPGHFKYKDVNADGVIDALDRTYIGSPHPDFTAGLSLNLGYKGFYLSTTLYASVGNEIINYVSRFIDYTQFESGKSARRLYESWGSPYLNGDNSKATMPIIYANDSGHQEASTAFMEDGSFLRMKHLRIGYDFNKLLKNKVGTLQLYFQASNLFTMTNYSGLDPEIAGAGINMGIDQGAWATPKQFMFGITFGL